MGKSPEPTVSQTDYEALASFRHALAKFLAFSAAAARSLGLSPQQHQALLALKGSPGGKGLTLGELADRLQLKHHSTVGLVDRLETKQVVVRTPDPHDRRVARVVVTAKGEKLVSRLSAVHRAELRRLAPELQDRLEAISRLASP